MQFSLLTKIPLSSEKPTRLALDCSSEINPMASLPHSRLQSLRKLPSLKTESKSPPPSLNPNPPQEPHLDRLLLLLHCSRPRPRPPQRRRIRPHGRRRRQGPAVRRRVAADRRDGPAWGLALGEDVR